MILLVSNRVCDLAFELCQKHPLKGPDAIHLAAVKTLLILRPRTKFFTLDQTLYRVVQKEKIPLVEVYFR